MSRAPRLLSGPGRFWRVAALALTLRIALFAVGPAMNPDVAWASDTGGYVELARNLVTCGVFAQAEDTGTFLRLMASWREASGTSPQVLDCGLRAESFRTPGYPLFVAISSLGTRELRWTLVVQVLLGAASSALIAATALRLGLSIGAAAIVGLLWAVHPALILFDNLLLSESLFDALLVLGFWTSSGRPSGWNAVIAGLVFGCAAMVRPPLGLLCLPTAMAWAWTVGWKRPLLAAMACASLLLPGGWVLRNIAIGEGVRLNTAGEAGLIFYEAPCVRADGAGRECESSLATEYATTDARLRAALQPGADPMALATRQALQDIIDHPVAAVRVQLRSWVKLAVGHSMGTLTPQLGVAYRPSGLFSGLVLREPGKKLELSAWQLAATLAWTGFNVLLLVLGCWGLVAAGRRQGWAFAGGSALLLAVFAATVLSLGQERFRLPMLIPLLLMVGSSAEGSRLASVFGSAFQGDSSRRVRRESLG